MGIYCYFITQKKNKDYYGIVSDIKYGTPEPPERTLEEASSSSAAPYFRIILPSRTNDTPSTSPTSTIQGAKNETYTEFHNDDYYDVNWEDYRIDGAEARQVVHKKVKSNRSKSEVANLADTRRSVVPSTTFTYEYLTTFATLSPLQLNKANRKISTKNFYLPPTSQLASPPAVMTKLPSPVFRNWIYNASSVQTYTKVTQ